MEYTVKASMLNGINGFIGWNIQSCMMLAFAIYVACSALPLKASVEDLDQNQCLHQQDFVTGSMLLEKLERFLDILAAIHINRLSQYKLNSKKGITIAGRLGSARSVTITQNRHYIGTIADIILLCSRQEIALRGHQESSDPMNRGNFLKTLHFIAKRDLSVKHRLENGPKNAK